LFSHKIVWCAENSGMCPMEHGLAVTVSQVPLWYRWWNTLYHFITH